jgi:DNA-binding transcriptional LysR family regulator
MTVSLRQLEYFITVVDEGSFTTAATRLHISQPGLSHQIQALERQLGGPLLERLPRGVRLTPAGRTALPHARASLAHAERAASAARRASGADAGELHVGTLYSISIGVLPAALRRWRRQCPDVQVRLVEFRHTNELVVAMEAGQADLAVGPTPAGWAGPVREIGAEEFVVAAAAGTRLPGAGPAVKLADLADHDWVHFTAPSGLGDVLDAACARAGFAPRAAVRTEQAPSALNLAAAGLGITLLPGNVVPPDFRGLLRWPDPPVRRMLSAYTRVRPDPVTAAFVEAISHHTLATPGHILSLVAEPLPPASQRA